MSIPSADFLIVGVGASAGGVEALQEFFGHVPADSGIAYVVILHLLPDHDSQLAAILQAVTPIPVTPVTERVRVVPNHVYVVSPNQHLAMLDGELTVSPNTLAEDRRAPIDIFFRTLADSHESRAVCVVLSGTGADGAMGLKRVKERGGAVFVQNPREAAFGEMPRSAIATELADAVLPVADIPARIAAYRASLGSVVIPSEADQRPAEQQQALREVFTQLRLSTGHDFSNYKRPTLLRRIERRISVRNLSDLRAYAAFLRETPEEPQALLKDLLISVTNFFRDKTAFDALEREVVPRLFHERHAGEQVRIWVIGCATGEEAYSLAMLCAEHLQGTFDAPAAQIFASDIDEAAIAHARAGLYTASDVADVSPERLRRFFTFEDQRYRVRREIRDMVLFANHNVLKDPPFSRMDLVSCRNMLIYLNQTAQERVLETVHFALNPGGFLFLGASESADGANDLFGVVNREQHIYRSQAGSLRPPPIPEAAPGPRVQAPLMPPTSTERQERAPARANYGDLHQRLLEQYAPPSLIVNEEFEVVHLSAGAGRYLQIAGGEISRNLLDLIRPELRLELRAALGQAVQRRTNVDARNVPIRIDKQTETVTIRVRPALRQDDPARGLLLVLFEPGAQPASDAELVAPTEASVTRQLEDEAQRLRAQLRISSEQYEVQAEELKASNEELQALNEELRSSTEELETSREELQSINEELRTVNQELKVKVEEATQTSANLRNLVNSTDIATIFLDRGLRVKLFTPAACELFNLIPADYGRPLSDLTHQLVDADVLADAKIVLGDLRTIEREVRAADGRVYLLRALPYRAAEDRIGGVVLTFVDITERARAERALRESEERLRAMIVNLPGGAAFIVGRDLRYLLAEGEALYIAGLTPSDLVGKTIFEAHAPELAKDYEPRYQQVLLGEPFVHEHDAHGRSYISHGTPLRSATGEVYAALVVSYDITERKRAEAALRESEARFRTLSDAVPQVIWVNDGEGTATYFNQRWYDYSGLSYDESAGPGWQAIVHPADAPASVERWQRALATGEMFDAEYRLRRADGAYRWHLGRNVPLRDAGGQINGWFGSATDIEDLKQAEAARRESDERFRLLVEGARDYAMFLLSPDNRIAFWSAGAERLFGWSEAEALGQGGEIIFTPEDRERGAVERELRGALDTGRAEDRRWHLRKDGSRLFLDGVMIRLDDTNGPARGFVKIARDATAQYEAEEALRRTRDELDRRVQERTADLNAANQALKQEVAERRQIEQQRVALVERVITAQEDERQRIARELHDSLGQYLSALMLRLSTMQQAPGTPPEVQAGLGDLRDLASQIDVEIDRLTMELRPPTLDDAGLTDALASYTAEWTATSGVPVDLIPINLDGERLPAAIEATTYRIVQEALTNVLKHAHASQVSIILERRPELLRVVVEDDGIGFDPSAATNVSGGGRHMGLINMTERAALAGGELAIESSPGAGATIFLTIPLADAAQG